MENFHHIRLLDRTPRRGDFRHQIFQGLLRKVYEEAFQKSHHVEI